MYVRKPGRFAPAFVFQLALAEMIRGGVVHIQPQRDGKTINIYVGQHQMAIETTTPLAHKQLVELQALPTAFSYRMKQVAIVLEQMISLEKFKDTYLKVTKYGSGEVVDELEFTGTLYAQEPGGSSKPLGGLKLREAPSYLIDEEPISQQAVSLLSLTSKFAAQLRTTAFRDQRTRDVGVIETMISLQEHGTMTDAKLEVYNLKEKPSDFRSLVLIKAQLMFTETAKTAHFLGLESQDGTYRFAITPDIVRYSNHPAARVFVELDKDASSFEADLIRVLEGRIRGMIPAVLRPEAAQDMLGLSRGGHPQLWTPLTVSGRHPSMSMKDLASTFSCLWLATSPVADASAPTRTYVLELTDPWPRARIAHLTMPEDALMKNAYYREADAYDDALRDLHSFFAYGLAVSRFSVFLEFPDLILEDRRADPLLRKVVIPYLKIVGHEHRTLGNELIITEDGRQAATLLAFYMELLYGALSSTSSTPLEFRNLGELPSLRSLRRSIDIAPDPADDADVATFKAFLRSGDQADLDLEVFVLDPAAILLLDLGVGLSNRGGPLFLETEMGYERDETVWQKPEHQRLFIDTLKAGHTHPR